MAIHALESKTKSKSTEACTIKLPPNPFFRSNQCKQLFALPPKILCLYKYIYAHP